MVSYLGYQSFLKEEPSGVGSLVPYLVVLLAAANLFIQDGCLWKWMPQQSKSLMLGTSVTLHLVQSFFFFSCPSLPTPAHLVSALMLLGAASTQSEIEVVGRTPPSS